MHRLSMAFLVLILFLSGCWIEEVDPPGDGGDSDTTSVFQDVSDSHIPAENLANSSMDAKAADIDGDGDLDLIIAVEFNPNKILINDGSGSFTDESDRLPDKNYDSEDIAIADFNDDGSLDIVFVSEDNQTNEYYLNRGDGTFEDVSNRIPVTGTSNAVLTTDINRDGFPDLAIGNNGPNVMLINDGQGYFSNQSQSRIPQINDITQDLAFADINGNGFLDLLVGNEDGNRLLLNNGQGIFTDRTQTRLPLIPGVEETREVDLADVDGDGSLDIYFANVILFSSGNSAQDRILINDGQGFFSDGTQARLPQQNTNTLDADFVDLDRDGDFDIIAGDFGTLNNETGNYSGNNYAKAFINDGAGFFSDQTLTYFPEDFSPKVVDFEIADFNGDGLVDIYVANFRSQDVLLLQQNN